MIQIIPFSFNRAMQLDTLLSTLVEHWKNPEYRIDVIYNFSSGKFGEAYKQLSNDYEGDNICLHKENLEHPDKVTLKELSNIYNLVRFWHNPNLRHSKTNFRSLMIKLMEGSDAENVMFLTDDAMFINDIDIPQGVVDWVNDSPSNRQFTLRLGKGKKPLPTKVKEEDGYCIWNMYENTSHWGYAFSVDSHIYNKKYLLGLLKKYIYNNPSTLEGYIYGNVRRKKSLAECRCFTDVKMLSFPINIVQSTVDNLSQNVSVEMLNERYLKGDRMRYVYDDNFDPDKLYVKELQFTDKAGNVSQLEISDELIRANKKQ